MLKSPITARDRTFAFGDEGSTSGYLIPYHHFQKNGLDPDTYLGRVVNTKHQAIEMQVTRGSIDAGADYNRNRDAMISEGLIKAEDSVVFWTPDPLPNDAVAVRAGLVRDAAFVARLRAALESVGPNCAACACSTPTCRWHAAAMRCGACAVAWPTCTRACTWSGA